jgi:hypothetical protein
VLAGEEVQSLVLEPLVHHTSAANTTSMEYGLRDEPMQGFDRSHRELGTDSHICHCLPHIALVLGVRQSSVVLEGFAVDKLAVEAIDLVVIAEVSVTTHHEWAKGMFDLIRDCDQ